MGKWIYLSYPLSPDTPAYGGADSLKVAYSKSINQGDSCNASHWSLPNHLGTHIDFPKHFFDDGKTAAGYSAEFWVFQAPHILDISPIRPGTIIGSQYLDLARISKDTDLLLLKTNFGNMRNKQIYWKENPGIKPDMASFLRKNLPNLRVLGFDFISLSSYTNRELGRSAHRLFLGHPDPILPLEDVNLSLLDAGIRLNTVIISPLIIKNADAAPCMVIGQISNGSR